MSHSCSQDYMNGASTPFENGADRLRYPAGYGLARGIDHAAPDERTGPRREGRTGPAEDGAETAGPSRVGDCGGWGGRDRGGRGDGPRRTGRRTAADGA